MMPIIHSALGFGCFALFALIAWKGAERFNLRVPSFDLRSRFVGGEAAVAGAWFPPPARASGNSAFDEWRDGEIARLEAQGRAFETFVEKLKRAKDRATFDQFLTAYRSGPNAAIDVTDAVDHRDHRPG